MDLLGAAIIFISAAMGATGASAKQGDRLQDAGVVFVRSWKTILSVAAGATIGFELARIVPPPQSSDVLSVGVLIVLGAVLIVRLIQLRNQRRRVERPPLDGPNHDNGD